MTNSTTPTAHGPHQDNYGIISLLSVWWGSLSGRRRPHRLGTRSLWAALPPTPVASPWLPSKRNRSVVFLARACTPFKRELGAVA